MTSPEELADLAVTLFAGAVVARAIKSATGDEMWPEVTWYEWADKARDLLNTADRQTQLWETTNGQAPWTAQEIAYQAARLMVVPPASMTPDLMSSAVTSAMELYLAAGRVLAHRPTLEPRGSRRMPLEGER